MYNEQRGIGGQTRKDSLYNLKSIFDNPIRVMLYETTLQDLPDDLEQLVMDGYM